MTIQELLNNSSTFVLDVRTPMEFNSGALPRAVLIPIDQLQNRTEELPENKTSPILVYCAHGVRSLTALKFLKSLGYTSVFNLEGGLATYGQKSTGF